MTDETWYVTTRRDNGYPLTVYADKERAELIARLNDLNVVTVRPVTEEKR
jgi:hypothetical protein